jgi:hypothetical protein
MFVKKVKSTLVAALTLVALGGAGVCAYDLRTREPAAGRENPARPPGKKAADKAPEKNADDLRALMRERLELAQDILKRLRSNPRASWNEVVEASQRVLQADLELCPNKAARIAARQRHVKVAEDLARLLTKRFKLEACARPIASRHAICYSMPGLVWNVRKRESENGPARRASKGDAYITKL